MSDPHRWDDATERLLAAARKMVDVGRAGRALEQEALGALVGLRIGDVVTGTGGAGPGIVLEIRDVSDSVGEPYLRIQLGSPSMAGYGREVTETPEWWRSNAKIVGHIDAEQL